MPGGMPRVMTYFYGGGRTAMIFGFMFVKVVEDMSCYDTRIVILCLHQKQFRMLASWPFFIVRVVAKIK